MLKLDRVSVDIAGIPVLRGITAQFESSATYAIVGRNGAGKTTLLRTIMGFTNVRAGTLQLAGVDLLSKPSFARAALGVGYAPEDRVLFPTMSVEDNLRLPCEAIGMHPADVRLRLKEAIDAVPQIEAMLPRSASALSGGQGKIAALARALMVATRVLLVDEPLQGLAPALAKQFVEAIARLHRLRPSLCVLITESNRALLAGLDCTTFVLERGELHATSNHAQGRVTADSAAIRS
ncbi:MAG TPA: ATP-binding cassette domain-containing protein [Casimicrobiaceae bacterium]|nr:ATP-binding cassette domain-containing protein [Casimicrobiaceae bacterium]